MFKDFQNSEKHLPIIESDLCVIGAGAAGITLAQEFQGTDLQVCLVESGGFESNDLTQSLCEGDNIGLPYFPLDHARLRFLGGTTNHWEGQCAPLKNTDFEYRPWVPYSGWPISKTDLDPYYKQAVPIVRIGQFVFDERAWAFWGMEPPAFHHSKIKHHFWQGSKGPIRFGEAYVNELKNSENITVILNANATNLHADKNGESVSHLEVATLQGRTGQITAKHFVLACGAIENGRLLLLSNQVNPKGLGNKYDIVGRFFQEHPNTRCGSVVGGDEDFLLETFKKNISKELVFGMVWN